MEKKNENREALDIENLDGVNGGFGIPTLLNSITTLFGGKKGEEEEETLENGELVAKAPEKRDSGLFRA